jgi:hypothetical protein
MMGIPLLVGALIKTLKRSKQQEIQTETGKLEQRRQYD